MSVSYTPEMKLAQLEDGSGSWGAVANGIYELLDKGHEITLVAGENIGAGDCVALKADGLIYKALCTDQALTPAIGFAPNAITSGNAGKVRGFGWIDVTTSWDTGQRSWSPGQGAYVDNVAGQIAKSWQSWSNYLGFAKSHTDADYTTRIIICPELRHERLLEALHVQKSATFTHLVDNGESGASATIDWREGNKQQIILTDDATLTFTAPPGPCNLVLKLIQDATGSRDPDWPATVKWASGTEPTWTTTGNCEDIVCFFFDGNSYYGSEGLDFS